MLEQNYNRQTSLTAEELIAAYGSLGNGPCYLESRLQAVANAAIKRYIEDNEKAPIVVKQPQPLAYP